MRTTSATSRLVLLVRGTYWLGAIFDALAGVRMVLADRIVVEGVVPGVGFRYAMWTAAALMFSWSSVLVWADRDPVPRRGVLLLTACPALLGLGIAQGVAVSTGFRTVTAAMPFWGLESALFVIFVVAYLVARTLAAGDDRG
jgi:hypothetical protein